MGVNLAEELGRGALRVPVRRMNLELHTVSGRCAAVIFLPAELSPQAVFEDDAPFFPTEEAGKVRLHARAAIVRLVLDAEPHESGDEHDVAIAVHLHDGSTITGELRSTAGLPRTVDILNQPSKSFAVRAGGKIHHIAKAHVAHVEELP